MCLKLKLQFAVTLLIQVISSSELSWQLKFTSFRRSSFIFFSRQEILSLVHSAIAPSILFHWHSQLSFATCCSHLINPGGKWQFLTAIPSFAISLGEHTARTPNLFADTPLKSNREVHLSKKFSKENRKFIQLSKAVCADYVNLQKLKPKPDNSLLVNAISKFPKALRSQPNIRWLCNQLNRNPLFLNLIIYKERKWRAQFSNSNFIKTLRMMKFTKAPLSFLATLTTSLHATVNWPMTSHSKTKALTDVMLWSWKKSVISSIVEIVICCC